MTAANVSVTPLVEALYDSERVPPHKLGLIKQIIDGPSVVDPAAAKRLLPLLSVEDLARLPQPSWLLDGLLPARAFTVLFGPSGIGKSFLALDWACCVASGTSWWGREATRGPVVYVAAEGAAGLHRRVEAWMTSRGVSSLEAIRFVPEAVNLLDATEVERAEDTIATLPEPPALIVIDTLARTMVGGDENAARDVGQFIAHADRLGAATGATRLVVHHTGKSGDDERGSSALRGAADMMAALREDGASLRLECSKSKDSEPFSPWSLHLGEVADSCVIRLGSNQGQLSDQEQEILRSLPAAFGSDPAPSTKLLKVSGVPERTFYRAVQGLTERGYLEPQTSGRSKLYTLTELGQTALLPTTANDCQPGTGITAATAGPLGPAGGSQPDSNRALFEDGAEA